MSKVGEEVQAAQNDELIADSDLGSDIGTDLRSVVPNEMANTLVTKMETKDPVAIAALKPILRASVPPVSVLTKATILNTGIVPPRIAKSTPTEIVHPETKVIKPPAKPQMSIAKPTVAKGKPFAMSKPSAFVAKQKDKSVNTISLEIRPKKHNAIGRSDVTYLDDMEQRLYATL